MKKYVYMVCALLLCSSFVYCQNSLHLIRFSSGYTSPLGVENCGDSRLFVVQKTGQIMICDSNGRKLVRPFLDISDRISFADRTSGEQGLLGLAFDPGYSSNGFFYVFYTNKSHNIQISRFRVSLSNPNLGKLITEKKILEIKKTYTYHNGGSLRFGPDGYLYIGTGDDGGEGDVPNNAQNPATLLGKMLRIDVHSGKALYNIPPTNPFVNRPGYKPEIWALGLRNPWRWSFDDVSGALMIGDVGQSLWEEINRKLSSSKGGENYGWRCYEGDHPFNMDSCNTETQLTFPKYEYAHSSTTGDCCVIGGFTYRGKKYPAMYGKYYFTDYCSGMFRSLTFKSGIATEQDELDGANHAYTSFGEDYKRELYVVNQNDSSIYRLAAENTATIASAPLASVSLSVYPNPARGYCTANYTTTKAEACTVSLYNATGVQLVAEKHISIAGKNNWQITIPANVKGECYISVTSASGTRIMQSILVQ
jgi:glucose/arabinose dehydrogenase